MSKRFVMGGDTHIIDTKTNEEYYAPCETELLDFLNEFYEENMDLRAKHTQMIIIMKDVVKDLKRMDTYRYAEHLEKIANLHFLSEKESDDE